MATPHLMAAPERDAWLAAHPDWHFEGNALTRTFTFADFSAALGFVVRVGLAAERHDHHPDIALAWGKASVLWTTHDAGGVTSLDVQLAGHCDALVAAQ